VLQVGLILGDHIPDNNSEFSGYYNVMSKDKKIPGINSMYKVIIHSLKPIYDLPAVENPIQKPPKIYLKKADGTLMPI
jgi:hypothetical protein